MSIDPTLVEQPNASGLVHRIWQPETPSGPTVIMVHGRSGNEDVTWVFARTLPPNATIVTPRALYEDYRGGFSWDVRPTGEWPTLANFAPAVTALDRFIQALPQMYGINVDEIYLMGFSQGAALSKAYALKHPQVVKGVVSLVGFAPVGTEHSAELPHLQDLPVFMAVGRRDETIPHVQSWRTANALIQAGTRLDYREYNTGHKLNMQGMKDLANWWERTVE